MGGILGDLGCLRQESVGAGGGDDLLLRTQEMHERPYLKRGLPIWREMRLPTAAP
jgi:hypothetical protein